MFVFRLIYSSPRKCFKFSDPEPMFELIYAQIERNIIGLADIIAIHCEVYEMAFDLIRELETRKKSSRVFDDFICKFKIPIALPSLPFQGVHTARFRVFWLRGPNLFNSTCPFSCNHEIAFLLAQTAFRVRRHSMRLPES